MRRLSKEAEERLLEAVKSATALVDEGLTPDEAIVKSAETHRLEPGLVPLVVQAYNTGRTHYQRESSSAVLDKLAHFPLADSAHVMQQLYPDSVESPAEITSKTVIASEYSKPPRPLARDAYEQHKKTAAAKLWEPTNPEPYGTDPAFKMARVYSQALADRRAYEEHRRECSAANDQLLSAFSKLGNYFKSPATYHLPFAEVEHNAGLLFGKAAQLPLNYVYQRNHLKELRASQTKQAAVAVSIDDSPYSLVADVLECAHKLGEKRAAWQAAQDTIIEKLAALEPFVTYEGPPARSILAGHFCRPQEKSANLMSGLVGGGMASVFKGTSAPKSPTQLVDDMEMELSDPAHENRLRAITAKQQLAELMSSDDVISGYDPEEVMAAYNDISSLAPRSSTQLAVIRPLLRKRLAQGAIEPFEAAEMANIEKTIADTENVSRKAPPVGNAPPVA